MRGESILASILTTDRSVPPKPNKEVFGKTLLELAGTDKRIVVCEADLMRASGTKVFKDAYPERHFNFGVAEQNMVAAAAGLAISGKTVFASTFANFASKRACDQMSISVAYNKSNVKLCGHYAGLTSEKNGGTHIGVEDIAIMRAMPNIIVLTPGDAEELRQAVVSLSQYEGPAYLRVPKMYKVNFFSSDYKFEIGKAAVISEGKDISVCSCGLMSGISLLAAERLKSEGVSVKVVNFGTIKPIDVQAVLDAAETQRLLTVENHSVVGALGSAIMEILSENRRAPMIKRLGLKDVFGQTASLDWQLEHNGLTVEQIVGSALEMMEN
jgi:transketolase